MTQEQQTVTQREMCDAFDVTARTLRFYEAKGLLRPERDGDERLYTRRDRARLILIQRGKRFGFSLDEIRYLLDLYDAGDQQYTQYVKSFELAQSRLRDIIAQRDELDGAIEELQDQLLWSEQVIASIEAKSAESAA